MSFGRAKKPCDEFKYWPNNSVCGKCAWPKDKHGTDAYDDENGNEISISELKLAELRKHQRRNSGVKPRNKMTHLTPKKKRRK